MAYTPTTWETGDTITATALNKLEAGVSDMSSGYTPYTWQTGDTITAARLNALEQGVAAGGGGSSDFSTATVTSINNTAEYIRCIIPCTIDYPEEGYYSSNGEAFFEVGTMTTTAILYKGVCNIYLPTAGRPVAISGDIEDDGDNYYIITGDCTITIS